MKTFGFLTQRTPVQINGKSLTVVPFGEPIPNSAAPGAWTLLLPQHFSLPNDKSNSVKEPFAFCCVADSAYLPFFFALVENLRAVHNGPLEVHLLALGDGVAEKVHAQFPDLAVRVYALEDVWTQTELAHLKNRAIGLQAYTCKPAVLLHARRNSDAQAIFLFDLDMYFYRSPARLNAAFRSGHTLVFPQYSDRFTWARLHGVINSGMIGVKRGSEAFIEWWKQACLIRCDMHPEQGMFGDQGFIDQAFLNFEGMQVYRGADEDVAPWNLRTLEVRRAEDGFVSLGDRTVGSFHAAGPDDLGVFEDKFVWDQLIALHSVADPDGHRSLFLNTLEQQRRHWPALDRALRLRALAENRLGVHFKPLDAQWTARATRGWRATVFAAIDHAHKSYAKWRGHAPALDAENTDWVQLQRAALFGPISQRA